MSDGPRGVCGAQSMADFRGVQHMAITIWPYVIGNNMTIISHMHTVIGMVKSFCLSALRLHTAPSNRKVRRIFVVCANGCELMKSTGLLLAMLANHCFV